MLQGSIQRSVRVPGGSPYFNRFLQELSYVLFEDEIDVLTEISVIRFCKFLDLTNHIFIQSNAYFGFIRFLCIHEFYYK